MASKIGYIISKTALIGTKYYKMGPDESSKPKATAMTNASSLAGTGAGGTQQAPTQCD